MKKCCFTLFLCLALFPDSSVFAGDSTIIANYPAPAGSYNRIVLQNIQTTPDCSIANNAGLLYYDTTVNALQLCAVGQSTPKTIPYPEQCFNRFCTGAACAFGGANGCPSGYKQAKQSGVALIDHFETATNGGATTYWISSTVCCTCTDATCVTNSAVLPT